MPIDPNALLHDSPQIIEGDYTVVPQNIMRAKNREEDPIQLRDVGTNSINSINGINVIDTSDPHRFDSSAVPYHLPMGPLRSLDPYKIQSKADLIHQLYQTLPINEFNLPTFIYRPDMLDHKQFKFTLMTIISGHKSVSVDSVDTDTDPESNSPSNTTSPEATNKNIPPPHFSFPARQQATELQCALSSATVELTYTEGYPTYKGFPIWERLPWESPEEQSALRQYLTIDGVRQISRLAAFDHNKVEQWYHTNYWALRSRAWDLYCIANAQRLKMQRAMRSEDDHFKKAGKILALLNNTFESIDFAERVQQLDPKDAVDILAKLVAIQRVSVGLPASGPPKVAEQKEAPTPIIMQQIVNTSDKPAKEEEKVDLLLESPENLEMAQRLIISVNGTAGAIDGEAQKTQNSGDSSDDRSLDLNSGDLSNNDDLPI